MFGDDDDDIFRDFNKKIMHDWKEQTESDRDINEIREISHEKAQSRQDVMSIVVPVLAGVFVVLAIAVLCHLYRRRNRAGILALVVTRCPVQTNEVPYAPFTADTPAPNAHPQPPSYAESQKEMKSTPHNPN